MRQPIKVPLLIQTVSVMLVAFTTLVARPLEAQRLVSGTVKSTAGAPLDRVWVQQLGTWKGSFTKADGVFSFPLGEPAALLLARDGYTPEIIATTGSERDGEQTVTMRRDTDAALNIRACRRPGTGLFPELELEPASNVKVKHGGEVDFAGYTATYRANGKPSGVLASMTGVHVAGLTLTPDWVKGLSSLTVGSVKCGAVQEIDLRGVSEGGLRSRWIGYAFGYAEYSRVPEKVAAAFDRAIDHGCCREPVSTKPNYPSRLR